MAWLSRWRGVIPRHPRLWAILCGLYWLTIFVATHIQIPEVPAAPKNTDKFVHFVMYAGLVFWLAVWQTSIRPWTRTLALRIFLIACIYAALDEILQIPIEGRSGDFWDFVMDVIGAMLGLLGFHAIRKAAGELWEAPSSER